VSRREFITVLLIEYALPSYEDKSRLIPLYGSLSSVKIRVLSESSLTALEVAGETNESESS